MAKKRIPYLWQVEKRYFTDYSLARKEAAILFGNLGRKKIKKLTLKQVAAKQSRMHKALKYKLWECINLHEAIIAGQREKEA